MRLKTAPWPVCCWTRASFLELDDVAFGSHRVSGFQRVFKGVSECSVFRRRRFKTHYLMKKSQRYTLGIWLAGAAAAASGNVFALEASDILVFSHGPLSLRPQLGL